MSDLMVLVSYTRNSGDNPATGLALADIALYLTAINKSTGARTVIWNGTQNPTFEVNNVGIYGRIYASADLETYNYAAGGLYSGGVALDNNFVAGTASSDADLIWEYSTRTLTQGAASIIATVTGSDVTVYRGTYWDVTLTGLPSLVDRSEVYLAVKRDQDDADNDAIVLWSLTTGLVRFNGAAATATDGTLTVPTNTSVNVTLNSSVTQNADLDSNLWYGIKRISGAGEAYATSEGGRWNIVADTPLAVA